MSGGIGRAALTGVMVAVVLTVAAVAGLFGWQWYREVNKPVPRVLVIVTAPGAEGGEVAPVAFVARSGDGDIQIVDTLSTATVPGTSAHNARDAYSFGGGSLVARALAEQTGGTALDWVVLSPAVWADLVDDAGGVSVDVPENISAYVGGKLTLLEQGNQSLSGDEVAALLSSADFLSRMDESHRVIEQVAEGVAVALRADDALRNVVSTGRAPSSVAANRLPDLEGEPGSE